MRTWRRRAALALALGAAAWAAFALPRRGGVGEAIPDRGVEEPRFRLTPLALMTGLWLELPGDGPRAIEARAGAASISETGAILALDVRLGWDAGGARYEASGPRATIEACANRLVAEFPEGLVVEARRADEVLLARAAQARVDLESAPDGIRWSVVSSPGSFALERGRHALEVSGGEAALVGDGPDGFVFRLGGPVRVEEKGELLVECAGGLEIRRAVRSSEVVARFEGATTARAEGLEISFPLGGSAGWGPGAPWLEAEEGIVRFSRGGEELEAACKGRIQVRGDSVSADGECRARTPWLLVTAREVLADLEIREGRIREVNAMGEVRLERRAGGGSSLGADHLLWDPARDAFTLWGAGGPGRLELDWEGRILQSDAHGEEE